MSKILDGLIARMNYDKENDYILQCKDCAHWMHSQEDMGACSKMPGVIHIERAGELSEYDVETHYEFGCILGEEK